MALRPEAGSRWVAVLVSILVAALLPSASAHAKPAVKLTGATLHDVDGDGWADAAALAFRPAAPRLQVRNVRVTGFAVRSVHRRPAQLVLALDRRGVRAARRAPRTLVRVRLGGRWTQVPARPVTAAPVVSPSPSPSPASPSPGPATSPSPGASTAAPAPTPTPTPADQGWQVLANPIDPRQQTMLGFCDRSHWIQPWRAYLDTRPASSLHDALGINLNVSPQHFTATAELLASAGFSRARVELGWDQMSYEDPGALREPAGIEAGLRELDRVGLRPLILLNANHGAPGPVRRWPVRLAAPALTGARTLQIDAESAAQVVPGLSGLEGNGRANDVVFTAVEGGTVTLSRPLGQALTAGRHAATTLRYEPFGRPLRADGSPNPQFEQSLEGWLDYVGAVTTAAREVFGNDFDVEIWNEQTFGADFLDAQRYYDPLPARFAGAGEQTRAILERTVAYLRDPAHGVAGIGISDGFASQTPFPSGATAPEGLTAMSKHPYTGPRIEFGASDPFACRPLDALGNVSGTQIWDKYWRDALTPRYVDYFPEYYLNAIQTEHLIRDVSPITTEVSGVPHGRDTRPGGGPAPEVWVTETNIEPAAAGLSGAAARRVLTKSTLRTLVSFVSKGVAAVDFYAAASDEFGLIDGEFFAAGGSGGSTIESLDRMLGRMRQEPIADPRSLELRSVADRGTHAQFEGDGSAAHPTLFDREVVAAFPFQVADDEFVVTSYVMTRDVAEDLAAAPFRLELGGVDGARATVTAYDPVLGAEVPATVVARTADSVTVQLPLTDSVRLLRLRDA